MVAYNMKINHASLQGPTTYNTSVAPTSTFQKAILYHY